MVKTISKITNIKLKKLINITQDRTGKDASYNLSSKKIRKELKWKPKITLEEGLKKTLNWIDNNITFLKRQKFYYIHKR